MWYGGKSVEVNGGEEEALVVKREKSGEGAHHEK